MKKTLQAAIAALAVFGLGACSRPAKPAATPTARPAATRPASPTATAFVPTAAPPGATATAHIPPTIEGFEQALQQAIAGRNLAGMAALMGDPFTIALWQSEGTGLAPADGAQQLANNYLGAGAVLTFDKPDGAELARLLKGADPRTMWGPGVKVASVILSQGWGADGKSIAFLVVAQRADGRFYWHGVLLAGAELLATPAPPTATPKPAGPAITSFACTLANLGTGKRATFTWATTGASKATIQCQTSMRSPVVKEVPPTGTTTIDLPETYTPNPTMVLVASDAQGRTARKEIRVDWPCRTGYFFPNGPGCPAGDPLTGQAGFQPFQNGRMVWLKELKSGDTVLPNQIIVLYNDGHWARFDDSWQENQPETDPSIVAPEGLIQPKRGFGKLWRSNQEVRNKLGWATVEEKPYVATYQWRLVEAPPAVVFLRTMDNQVVELSGERDGTWKPVP